MMKKLYSPFFLRTAFVVLLMLTAMKGWGQTPFTITYTGGPGVNTAGITAVPSPSNLFTAGGLTNTSPYNGVTAGCVSTANGATTSYSTTITAKTGYNFTITRVSGTAYASTAGSRNFSFQINSSNANFTTATSSVTSISNSTSCSGNDALSALSGAFVTTAGNSATITVLRAAGSAAGTGYSYTKTLVIEGEYTAISSSPTITVSSALTGLNYNFGSGPSNAQTFTVAGTNLTNNITVDSPANFQIATSLGGPYSNSVTLNQSGGTVATTTLYTRLIAGLAVNTYTGNINVSSSPATAQTISLSGTVSPVVNYTLTYNGNGNDIGTPPNPQTGATTYTVEGNPGNLTRFGGYYFMGWTINSNGSGTPYGPGDASLTPTISLSANTTLYARYVYTIIYQGNGNTGGAAPAQQTNYNSLPTTVSGAGTLLRDGYTFTGWNTAADGSGVNYAAGSSFVPSTGITQLHAQWLLNVPVISASGTLTARTTTYGAPSANATFTVSTNYLTNPLIITAPTGFEVSLAAGTGFATSLDLGTGTRTNTTIYVRLAATTPVGTAHTGNVAVTSTGATSVNVSIPNSTVTAKGLAITGLTATPSKIYDGNTSVTLTGSPAYNGLVNGEVFTTVLGTVTWAYPDANFGTGKVLVRTGTYLPPSGNYTVTQPTGLTADITKKALSVSAPSIASKVYDGNAVTGTVTPGTITGFVGTETVTATATGTFDAPNATDAGTNKPATIIYTLVNGTNGGLAINYSLANGTGTGNITRATAIISPNSISVSIGTPYTLPGGISSTSDGAITYTMTNNAYATLTGSTINGLAEGTNTLTVTQAQGTNHLAGSSSVTITVTDVAIGTYETTSNGNWPSAAGAATWRRMTATGWDNSAARPGSGATDLLIIRHDITTNGSFAASGGNKIMVENGGKFTNVNSSTLSLIHVKNGGEFVLGATGVIMADNDSKKIVESGGTLTVTVLLTNALNFWRGTEDFKNGSTVDFANHNGALLANPSQISNNTNGYLFGNLKFSGSVGTMTLVGTNSAANFNLVENDFTLDSSSNNILIVSAGSKNIVINGNTIINAGTLRGMTALSSITLNGNLEINNGTVNIGATSNGSLVFGIKLKGDLKILNSSTLTTTDPDSELTFEGVGTGLTPETTQNIFASNAATITNVRFKANADSYVKLDTNITLPSPSTFTVNSGGTLDFGFDSSNNALNISGNAFESQASSILKITSPFGINTTGSTGNVQVTAANRNISQLGTFHYIGRVNQVTGNALSTSSEKNVIVEMNADNLVLTPSAAFGITNTGVLDIRKGGVVETATEYITGSTGTLKMAPATYYKITKASLTVLDYIPRLENVSLTGGEIELASTGNQTLRGGKIYYDLTFSNGAIKEVSSGTADINGLISIMANTTLDGKSYTVGKTVTELLMDSGSLFKTGGNGAKPDAGGDYVLDQNSTIEFQGASATDIRVTPTYEKVVVSGSNVKQGGLSLIVNQNTTVTPSGKLTIPSSADNATSHVLSSSKGIDVQTQTMPTIANGQLIFENNAQLMQNTSAVNSGNVNVQRTVDLAGSRSQYNYLISPVIDQTMKTIFGGIESNVPFVLRYNESNDKFPNAGVGEYIPGKAYAVKQPIASFTGQSEFKGRPQNGSFSYNLEFTDSEHGLNLVGNPYPSNINIKKLYDDSAGQITEQFKFWDNKANAISVQQGSAYKGAAYAVFNAASGTMGTGTAAPGNSVVDPNNPSSPAGTKTPNYIVKVGQGFLVKATSAGPLNFSNDIRITNQTAAQFFGKNQEELVDDRYWIEMVTPANMIVSNAIVYFEGGNNAFAKDDTKEVGTSDALFTFASNNKVVINGRSVFNVDEVLPLGTRHFAAGIHHIKLGNKEGVFANGQSIYLKDKQNGIITDLSQNSYAFSANAGEINNRFEIIYKPESVLATDTNVKESLQVYRNGEDFIVKSIQNKIQKVDVYDANGRLLRSIKGSAEEIKIDASMLPSGMYILNINRNKEVINKKIIK